MARQARIPPVLNPWLAWYQFSLGAAQTMVDSAQVIALRTNRIVQAGASPGIRDRAEMRRMGQEKVSAAAESGAGVMLGMFALNSRLWMAGMQQWMNGVPLLMSLASSLTPAQAVARHARLLNASLAGAAAASNRTLAGIPRIASQALRPVRSRTKANVKRLRQR